mgnify:CR=1 FL=1|tara:strand:- start:303 stop:1142 length:840 start_codon:yes stop_codon:yes gene_type:complete
MILLNNLKSKFFNFLPSILQSLINNLRFLPDYLTFLLNPKGSKKFDKVFLNKKNKYKGCRCVIIGNGPSLKDMDLSILKNEHTIGLNRIYLIFKELGFNTDYLVAINRLVIEQFSNELESVESYKLFNWKYRKYFLSDSEIAFSVSRPMKMKGNLSKGFYGFHGTVANVAIEFAYYLGFDEIILIGIDHNWRAKGEPDKEIQSEVNDSDHFHPDYFGKGVSWQLPNYKKLEFGYKASNDFILSKNKIIVDATKNGKLQIFKKVALESYLKKSNFRNKVK